MNRSEFLNQLREALANDLNASAVQENVDYYNSYIQEEIKNGKAEAEVLEMLGDPWVIARNIIDSPAGSRQYGGSSYTHEPSRSNQRDHQENRQSYSNTGISSWWRKLVLILTVVGVIVVILAVITGLLRLFLPFLIPLLIIMFIVRLLSR